ncbi:hypothetical protein HFZ78_01800 [Priestia megaterium]|uniref:Uncharacterized protein n=1 Tax=Priestia megaterium TaxID=1404 RepID=A0A6H1NX20_PRIMG|nr:hypothetical protein [Priestia megaterium]QIZ05631.1 hypothetical protein HFZ78_01800 [Priestia megaterium]
MTVTKHVIQRFQERITDEPPEVVQHFIESDLKHSTHLYRLNHIEKRISNGVIYVLDCTKETNPVVLTLYLA